MWVSCIRKSWLGGSFVFSIGGRLLVYFAFHVFNIEGPSPPLVKCKGVAKCVHCSRINKMIKNYQKKKKDY